MFTQPPFKKEVVKKDEKTFVQLFWMTEGSMTVDFGGEEYQLYPGYVIYTMPYEAYTIKVHDGGGCYRWITFDGENAVDFMLSFGYPRGSFYAGVCPIQYFVNFSEHLLSRTPYSWRRMLCEICNILSAAGGTMDSQDTENNKLYEILIYCREHFADPALNINIIADEFKLNRSTLLRMFREKMNSTPSEYLSLLRLQRALSLLNDPRFTVAQIAENCGFSDCNYFCRFIKKNTGKRPSQLR